MISHILVPLDGSALAECVLPHVLAIASSVNTRVTLLHVLEPPHAKGEEQTIDPLEWHLKKREARIYLDGIARRLQETGRKVENVILEGLPADCVIDFANNNDVQLIILSTHGRSGLSGWNVSSVVQKIILRSFKSTLLVRAYKNPNPKFTAIRYNRLFVGLDCSDTGGIYPANRRQPGAIQQGQTYFGNGHPQTGDVQSVSAFRQGCAACRAYR